MPSSDRAPSPRFLLVIAVVLIYSLTLPLFIFPDRSVAKASLIRRVAKDDGYANAAPLPSPTPSATPVSTPSPTPEPVETPTPEPMPSITPATVPSPTQQPPETNLPNLDILRNLQPEEPETPETTPSTRCSPGQPDCNPGTGVPTPPVQALRSDSITPSPSRLIPSLLNQPLTVVQSNLLAPTSIKANHFTRAIGKASLLLRPQPQTGGTYDDFVMARLDPDNRTGTGGEDILSRNFNWSIPLVSMAGRAGLNLGLSLSYNSLVWTKAGNYITYDADAGYPTPGFRLGFPVIYGTHYNSQTGTYGYLMLMPSGARVELRRVGTTNLYEAADSSYLQLTDNGNGTLLVRSTDGTQLSYTSTSNGYRCTQVKDRNGNYLTVSNNSQGRILSVTDTLGRVFNFNYDPNNNLASISQTRGSTQYGWIKFGYTNLTLQTNFTGLTIIGTQSGTTLPVLSQISLPDGTYYKFSYNSWGQVYKIAYYAADSNPDLDNHALNYILYNLPLTSSTAQTDCPRFTQRKDWAENWNGGNEAVTNYTPPVSTSWSMPGGGTQSGTFCQRQTPDGVYDNVYFHSSGWDEGMPVLVNTWANNDQQQLALQRQETSTYTQDNTSVSYMLNPRVTETNIFDPSGNHKRVSTSYSSFTLTYGSSTLTYYLPYETKEYAADATSIWRTTQTDYNLGSDYTSRRIFGLASQKRVYDTVNGNALLSKVDFIYDDGGEFMAQQGTPIQHDETNNGASFVAGRGNLTRVRKWDVINAAQSVEAKIGYNTTGSVIFTRDPLNHQQSISYTDAFSDASNMNTYALPTTLTDADGNQSTSQYSYHLGAVTRTQGAPTNTASPATATGAYVTYYYDTIGRLYLTTNSFNGAYTYTLYPTSSNVIQTYTTIKDTQSATVSSKLFDGAGRVRATASDYPNSAGYYVGQYFTFDVMGRVIATSNPTKIYGSWQPAGEDAAGWVWSYQTFDWKGRPRVTTNQDGTTKETTYGGCGCAGGQVVTMRDEMGRKQRVTHDVLGRVVTNEEFEWNGTDVYRTTTNTYNGRDQLTQTVVRQGSSGTGQTATMTYDGYGRLATNHAPIQSSGTYTSYTYNNDDTIATITDARGIHTSYTYNNRKMLTGISYPDTQSPASGIRESSAITFAYDAAGNRTSMTDGLGSVSYNYDQLSRLISEARTFTGVGTYTLSYGYNLAGQLTSITEPWNTQVGYTRDITGRIQTVTGSGFANQTQYATNFAYRAWGALKSLTYSNNVTLEMSYTNRMQVSNYKLNIPATSTPTLSMDIDYSYLADGRLRNSTDHKNATLDRAYNYDQAGRLKDAFTGSEARSWLQNGTIGSTVDGPYRQNYTYDFQSNMVTKWGRSFTGSFLRTEEVSQTYDQSTGRNTSWNYDNDGRVLSGEVVNSYDEAGMLRQVDGASSIMGQFDYDGNGQKGKKYDVASSVPAHTYYLRSSVLGQTIAEIESYSGTRLNGFVYADGQLIATQASGAVYWQHTDPSGKSRRTTLANGSSAGKDEVDPSDVRVDRPEQPNHNTGTGGGGHAPGGGEAHAASLMNIGTCDFDGMAVPCAMADSFHQHVDSLDEISWLHFLGYTIVLEPEDKPDDDPPGGDSTTAALAEEVPLPTPIDPSPKPPQPAGLVPKIVPISEVGKQQGNTSSDRNIPDKLKKQFNDSLAEAKQRLGNEDCAKLYNKSSADLIAMLEKTEYRYLKLTQGGPSYNPDTGTSTVTAAQTNSPTSVFINSQGPFFNNKMMVVGAPRNPVTFDFGSRLTGKVFSALLLLHELGHQAGVFEADSKDAKLNRRHTKQVQDACFR